MRINVGDLRRHPGQSEPFFFSQEFAPLQVGGETVTFVAPVRVEGRITSGQRVLVVRGGIRSVVRRECSRCLSPFEEEVVAPLEEEFVHTSQVGELDAAAREEARVFGGEEIDLRPAVEEALVLALPMKALCRPDCEGLCPRCGRERRHGSCGCPPEETDERLAVLRNFFRPPSR